MDLRIDNLSVFYIYLPSPASLMERSCNPRRDTANCSGNTVLSQQCVNYVSSDDDDEKQRSTFITQRLGDKLSGKTSFILILWKVPFRLGLCCIAVLIYQSQFISARTQTHLITFQVNMNFIVLPHRRYTVITVHADSSMQQQNGMNSIQQNSYSIVTYEAQWLHSDWTVMVYHISLLAARWLHSWSSV